MCSCACVCVCVTTGFFSQTFGKRWKRSNYNIFKYFLTFPYSNTNLQGSHNIISCFLYLYYFILVKLLEFDMQILIPVNHGVIGRIERIHCGPAPHQHKGSFTQEEKNTSLWFIFNERHTESSKLQAVLVAVKAVHPRTSEIPSPAQFFGYKYYYMAYMLHT